MIGVALSWLQAKLPTRLIQEQLKESLKAFTASEQQKLLHFLSDPNFYKPLLHPYQPLLKERQKAAHPAIFQYLKNSLRSEASACALLFLEPEKPTPLVHFLLSNKALSELSSAEFFELLQSVDQPERIHLCKLILNEAVPVIRFDFDSEIPTSISDQLSFTF